MSADAKDQAQQNEQIEDLGPETDPNDAGEVKGGFNPQPDPPRELLSSVKSRLKGQGGQSEQGG